MYLPTAYDSTAALLEAALNAMPAVEEEMFGTQEARTRIALETRIRGGLVHIDTRKIEMTSATIRL